MFVRARGFLRKTAPLRWTMSLCLCTNYGAIVARMAASLTKQRLQEFFCGVPEGGSILVRSGLVRGVVAEWGV